MFAFVTFERKCIGEGGGERPGEADRDEHAPATREPSEVQENRNRHWEGSGGGDQPEPLQRERVQVVP